MAAALVVAASLDLLGLRVLGLWPAGLLIALNALVVYDAWRLVSVLGSSDDWDLLVLDVGIVALGIILLTILVLGSFGWLSLAAAGSGS